jgi:hypothetical protein
LRQSVLNSWKKESPAQGNDSTTFMGGAKTLITNGASFISPASRGSCARVKISLKLVRGNHLVLVTKEETSGKQVLKELRLQDWKVTPLSGNECIKLSQGIKLTSKDDPSSAIDVDLEEDEAVSAWVQAGESATLSAPGALPLPILVESQAQITLLTILAYSFMATAWEDEAVKGWLNGTVDSFFPFKILETPMGYIEAPQNVQPTSSNSTASTSSPPELGHIFHVSFLGMTASDIVPVITFAKPDPDKKAIHFGFHYKASASIDLLAKIQYIKKISTYHPTLNITEVSGEGLLHYEEKRITMSCVCFDSLKLI